MALSPTTTKKEFNKQTTDQDSLSFFSALLTPSWYNDVNFKVLDLPLTTSSPLNYKWSYLGKP